MTELSKQLEALPTYGALAEVEAEIKGAETPKDFDPNNPDHLREQLERLERRAGIDHAAAVSAFRLEVVGSSDVFDTTTRLALLAAFDPEVRTRLEKNRKHVMSMLDLKGKEAGRREAAHRLRARLSLMGVEGYTVPSPLGSAELLVDAIRKARQFAEANQGERIAILDGRENVIIGRMPDADRSFPLNDPMVEEGEIVYTVPSEFSGVSVLELHSAKPPYQRPELTIAEYPNLLEETEEGMTAHPQINEIRQQLGFLGVNIFRKAYFETFRESVIPESDVVWLPAYDPPQRRRRARRALLR